MIEKDENEENISDDAFRGAIHEAALEWNVAPRISVHQKKKSFISTSPGLAPAILVPTHTGKWIYNLISQWGFF